MNEKIMINKNVNNQYSFIEIEQKALTKCWIYIILCYYLAFWTLGRIIPKIPGFKTTALSVYIINLVEVFISLLFLFVVLRKYIVETVNDIKNDRLKSILKWIGKGLIIDFVIRIVIAIVMVVLKKHIPELSIITVNQTTIDKMFKTYRLLGILLFSILGPIEEELIFRSVIYHSFRKIGKFPAFAVSILLFAGSHVINELLSGEFLQALIASVSYLSMGFVLCYLYEKRRNVIVCIAFHILINSLGLVMSFARK